MFISFEGTDGAGKSVQANRVKNFIINNYNIDVIIVRDPGSTQISEKLRNIVLDKENSEMCYQTEALIYAAARAQMVNEIIRPNLELGKYVICDRYVDSSLVYQGISRGLTVEGVRQINDFGTGCLNPDITFFLDLPPEIGLSRKSRTNELDRIEIESNDFHDKVRMGYLELAKLEPNRIKVIDATQSITAINKEIVNILVGILDIN